MSSVTDSFPKSRTIDARVPKRCEYCGDTADTVDHAVPRKMRYLLQDLGGWQSRYPNLPDTVPACLECNDILNDRIFETMEERRDFVHHGLRSRYKDELTTPFWSARELEKLGPTLRAYISAKQATAEIVRARLEWKGNKPLVADLVSYLEYLSEGA